jgi:SAM-dependent methyltransferase
MPSTSFHGFEIPDDLIHRTGGGPETLTVISEQHIRNLSSQHPLTSGLRVLEIGCGIGRDAIPLAALIGANGSYIGTDVIYESIEWCQRHVSARHPNFEFVWHDIRDSLHNPGGELEPSDVRLPAAAGSVDLVFAQSVFTHMLPDQFQHFLAEAARVVSDDGTVYLTCFRVDQEILDTARRTNLTQYDLRFEHQYSPGCYVNELDHLTGAVAYEMSQLRRLVDAAGLQFRGPVRLGAWSGHFPVCFDGQDVLVLARRPTFNG